MRTRHVSHQLHVFPINSRTVAAAAEQQQQSIALGVMRDLCNLPEREHIHTWSDSYERLPINTNREPSNIGHRVEPRDLTIAVAVIYCDASGA